MYVGCNLVLGLGTVSNPRLGYHAPSNPPPLFSPIPLLLGRSSNRYLQCSSTFPSLRLSPTSTLLRRGGSHHFNPSYLTHSRSLRPEREPDNEVLGPRGACRLRCRHPLRGRYDTQTRRWENSHRISHRLKGPSVYTLTHTYQPNQLTRPPPAQEEADAINANGGKAVQSRGTMGRQLGTGTYISPAFHDFPDYDPSKGYPWDCAVTVDATAWAGLRKAWIPKMFEFPEDKEKNPDKCKPLALWTPRWGACCQPSLPIFHHSSPILSAHLNPR